ncbi:MAG: 4-alpha-glucanotransferase [Gaiellaceae bacterium]
MLLHPTSLPGGRLDAEAYRFVDWLAAAGQSWWQVLPLGPPDSFGSPYGSPSAFAGSVSLLAEPEAPVSSRELERFRAQQSFWLDDFVRHAGPEAGEDVAAGQVRFMREWGALRAYAKGRGIGLIGDVPIFVSRDSVDVAAHPRLFRTDVVAGAAPDLYSDDGQLWDGAVYDWPALSRRGYRWWIERFRRVFELVDMVRLDHFRGFVAMWTVPLGARTAASGQWRRGPGMALFRAVQRELGALDLIAEDLGVITPAVDRLRAELGIPGIRVLQFALDGSETNPHRLENHEEQSVVYTGTHDNDTALGWWSSLSPGERARAGLDAREPHWSLIERALSSPARIAVVPLQDVLGLASEARMNVPGTTEGNWIWRFGAGALTSELAARLRKATAASGRSLSR